MGVGFAHNLFLDNNVLDGDEMKTEKLLTEEQVRQAIIDNIGIKGYDLEQTIKELFGENETL